MTNISYRKIEGEEIMEMLEHQNDPPPPPVCRVCGADIKWIEKADD
jgi:hypothetical protein